MPLIQATATFAKDEARFVADALGRAERHHHGRGLEDSAGTCGILAGRIEDGIKLGGADVDIPLTNDDIGQIAFAASYFPGSAGRTEIRAVLAKICQASQDIADYPAPPKA